MLNDYIKPGQRVELQTIKRVKLNGKSEEEKVYSTKIYDIVSDERLEILMPIEKTKLILLPVDAEYEMVFYAEKGLYECFAKIIDRYKSNNVYILVMELTTNLRKHQRREYYRFSCALDMNTRVLADEEIKAAENHQKYLVPGLPLKRSIIVDISGGGIRFISNFEYEKGSLIYCNYRLLQKSVEKNYEIVGKVLDVKPLENRPNYYEHRVQYLDIDKETREGIIQYIFEEERRSRKK